MTQDMITICSVMAIINNRCSEEVQTFINKHIRKANTSISASVFVDDFVNDWCTFRMNNQIPVEDDRHVRSMCTFMNEFVR
jgi:hypothetical protein